MKEILERRSIRKYQDKRVEKSKIEKLLRAAMQAPSAVNQQPWEFLVVEDRAVLEKLSDISPYAKFLKGAPLAIILLGNKDRMKSPDYWEQDLGAATQNLILEAVSLELGSVWLGVAPMKDRMEYIEDLFALKDNLLPYNIISIGYLGEGQENKFIDRFDASRIHYEKID